MPQGPGQQGQVIDYNTLYKAGRATSMHHGEFKRGNQTSGLERFAFQFLGNTVLNYVNETRERRKTYADNNIIKDKDFAATIAEDKGIKGIMSEAVQEWTKERNEGQKLVAKYHGFPDSKKYKKGVELMNNAQNKLENLMESAKARLTMKNNYTSMERENAIMDANGEMVATEYDPGNTAEMDRNTIALVDGSLDASTFINDNGELSILKETYKGGFGVDENGDPVFGTTAETKHLTFNEMRFNKFLDKSALEADENYKKVATDYGKDGLEWDETLELGIKADIKRDFDKMSTPAFRSWFFGGTSSGFTDSGKNFMTPAESFLAEKYSDLWTDVENCKQGNDTQMDCSHVQAQWSGLMDNLKEQDLQASPEYKRFAIDGMLGVAKHHHLVAKSAYDKKNQPKLTKPGKPTQWEVNMQRNMNTVNRIYSGEKFTNFSDNNDMKFIHLGNGKTEVWRWGKKVVTQDGEKVQTEGWVKGEEIPSSTAVEMMGYGDLGIQVPESYRPAQSSAGTVREKPAPWLIDYSRFMETNTADDAINKYLNQ